MIKLKKLNKQNNTGYSLVLLWLISITGIFQMNGKGDHLHFALGVGPFELSLGATIWRSLP
jgi:hypothetical protein